MTLLLAYTVIHIHVSIIQFACAIYPISDVLYTTHTTFAEVGSPRDRLLFSCCLSHHTCLLLPFPLCPDNVQLSDLGRHPQSESPLLLTPMVRLHTFSRGEPVKY